MPVMKPIIFRIFFSSLGNQERFHLTGNWQILFKFSERTGNYRPVILSSVSGKITEKLILRVIEKNLK